MPDLLARARARDSIAYRRLFAWQALPAWVAAMALLVPMAAIGNENASARLLFHSDLENLDAACFAKRPAAGCDGWMGIHDSSISICRAGHGRGGRGEEAHAGKQVFKIDFTRNEQYGGAWRAVKTRHIFTRFYDYYDKDFDFAAGMKIHRISSFNESKQVNDFDIILQLKADEPGSNNCGLTDAKYLALSCNGSHPVDWGSVEVRWTPMRERWYAIETEVKLNTPGRSDGEVRLWIDGRQVAEKTGMNITDTVSAPINRVMFGGWYSNSAAGKNRCPDPVKESIRYVDDPTISTEFIGTSHRGDHDTDAEHSVAHEQPSPQTKADPPQPQAPARAHARHTDRYDPIPD